MADKTIIEISNAYLTRQQSLANQFSLTIIEESRQYENSSILIKSTNVKSSQYSILRNS